MTVFKRGRMQAMARPDSRDWMQIETAEGLLKIKGE